MFFFVLLACFMTKKSGALPLVTFRRYYKFAYVCVALRKRKMRNAATGVGLPKTHPSGKRKEIADLQRKILGRERDEGSTRGNKT